MPKRLLRHVTHQSINLSDQTPVYGFYRLSIQLPSHPPVSLSLQVCICLSGCLFSHLSLCSSVCLPPEFLSVSLLICLSTYQPTYLSAVCNVWAQRCVRGSVGQWVGTSMVGQSALLRMSVVGMSVSAYSSSRSTTYAIRPGRNSSFLSIWRPLNRMR